MLRSYYVMYVRPTPQIGSYYSIRDLTTICRPQFVNIEVIEIIVKNTFSSVKFCVPYKYEFRNAKCSNMCPTKHSTEPL